MLRHFYFPDFSRRPVLITAVSPLPRSLLPVQAGPRANVSPLSCGGTDDQSDPEVCSRRPHGDFPANSLACLLLRIYRVYCSCVAVSSEELIRES